MDIFSHSLWGYGLFGRHRPWLAMAFGAMPDLVSFGAFAVIRLVNGNYVAGKPSLEIIPAWCFLLYDLSHSLLIDLLACLLVFWQNRALAFVMLAWPFHILLDIPFHTRHYFPTKFFYPLTDYFYDGIAWNTPVVWLPNIAGVVVVVGYRLWQRKRLARSG
ncbi:MAG: hypothetical protein PF568_05580 [Deltaproteobacteria bacterium]|jgi:branched-subunit amino acid transport protein AzlD|nr:hypothetical protein [Deltaproteobacteria bacterium]